MSHPAITVTIITLNEEKNLERAIKSVSWADEILVVDSGSADKTVEIARANGATVIHNNWKGYGQQKNFAQDNAKHDWVLNIDADEAVTPELRDAIIRTLKCVAAGQESARGFFFPRKTFYLGRWIMHGGWYPNHLVRLAHRSSARWTEPAVHEELKVEGKTALINTPLLHYTFGCIADQVLTNLRFARLGAQHLSERGQAPNILKMLLKPLGKFFETYIIKAGFLDGLPGFIISINAAHSMFLKYGFLIESQLTKPERKNENTDHRQQS